MADGGHPIVMPLDAVPLRAGLKIIGFAGGGGSSWALKKATGQEPDLAMNHWTVAVDTHKALFPNTEHFCEDIFAVDPLGWRPGEPIRWAWFSPDCTDHSKAKGSAPKSERIRGLAWSIIPWAKTRRPQTIMFENVEEWWDWGPIWRCADDWRAALFNEPARIAEPIKALRGTTRALFVRRLMQCGYWPEFRELRTAAYGRATTRKRLYGIFEYVGVEEVARIALGLSPSPIRWAEATHAKRGKAEALGLKPWVGFDTCADWSEPCPSIFLTPEECEALRAATGRKVKRPLVKATLARVARGLDRYVISSASPFLVPITHTGDERAHGVRDPLRTITAARGGEFAMVSPHVTKFRGGATGHAADDPLALVTGNSFEGRPGGAVPLGVVTAYLAGLAHGEHARGAGSRARAATDPIATVSAGGNSALVTGFLAPSYGERDGLPPRCLDVEEPYPTAVPGQNGGKLVAATLVGCGGRRGQSPAVDVGEPLPTVTGTKRGDACLTSAYLMRQFGSSNAADVEDPVGTIVAGNGPGGHKTALVSAHLGSYYGTMHGSEFDAPMNTATGKDRHAMTMAWLEQANTGMVGHQVTEPLSTIVAGGGPDSGWAGATQRLIQARLELDGPAVGRRDKVLAFLWEHFGLPTADEWDNPTATLEARRKFGLVIIAGQTWMIVDIGLRMLLTKELAAATGLPPEHIVTHDCHGRPISKTNWTMMIGNMVPDEPAASLIATHCPDMIREGWAA